MEKVSILEDVKTRIRTECLQITLQILEKVRDSTKLRLNYIEIVGGRNIKNIVSSINLMCSAFI